MVRSRSDQRTGFSGIQTVKALSFGVYSFQPTGGWGAGCSEVRHGAQNSSPTARMRTRCTTEILRDVVAAKKSTVRHPAAREKETVLFFAATTAAEEICRATRPHPPIGLLFLAAWRTKRDRCEQPPVRWEEYDPKDNAFTVWIPENPAQSERSEP